MDGTEAGKLLLGFAQPWMACIEVMMYYIFMGIVEDAERENGATLGRFLMASFLPLNTVLGISFSMNSAVYDIVGEKDQKMKVLQNIYGLSENMYWLTWYVFYLAIAFVCLCLIYICWLAVIPVLETVNFLISLIILSTGFVQALALVPLLALLHYSCRFKNEADPVPSAGQVSTGAHLMSCTRLVGRWLSRTLMGLTRG